MELDSTLALLALVISTALYFLVAFGEHGLIAARRSGLGRPEEGKPPRIPFAAELYANPRRATGGLRFLQRLLYAASLVSAVALAAGGSGLSWVWVFVAGLGAVIMLLFLLALAQALAPMYTERMLFPLMAVSHFVNRVVQPWRNFEAGMIRLVRNRYMSEGRAVPEGLVRIEISVESNDGPLGEREERMIRAVVRQDKTQAREIMVPREDIVAVEEMTPLAAVTATMIDSGHSRLPVYRERLDQVVGLIYARDILRVTSTGVQGAEEAPLADVLRPALFIPESKNLEELLGEFQESRVHIALVVDEHGGIAGLVTIEDLLEEIVGEIRDEFDTAEPEFHVVNDKEMVVDARINLDKLMEQTGVALQREGFDSLGGLVYHKLGRMGVVGDVVEIDGLKVKVESTVGRRLKRLRVIKQEPPARDGSTGK
ncbi:MAG: HlyC/CorC family transporter [SAR202 cluster bacterium]|nr:HlyC/CorC family transporter [SAR202 cluster bacterium]